MNDLEEFMSIVGTRTKPIYYIQYKKEETLSPYPMAPGGAICWKSIEVYILREEPKGAFLILERKGKNDHDWRSALQSIQRTKKQGFAEVTSHLISEDTRHLGYIDCDGDRYYILPEDNSEVKTCESEACDGGG